MATLELGYITIEWALVEDGLDEIVALLAPLEDGPVSHVVTGNTDIRAKVQIVKGLAFLRSFDDNWRDDTLFMLEHIDNDLRVRRNAAIHARWSIPSGRLQRRTRRTKVLRPQSRQLILETEQNVPVKITELRSLTRDLQEAWLALMPLFWFMSDGKGGYIKASTSPKISYKQYLRWAGFGNPVKRIRAKLLRQRKSSRG